MQAIIITAHNNIEQVFELVKLLRTRFEIYIHFDKKITFEKVKELGFDKLQNVHVYTLFHVNWGGAALLWAILYLLNEILKNKDITYIHIISGQDFPCKKLDDIYGFFETKNNIYMEFSELSKTNKIHMQKYYSFLNLINYRSFFQKVFVRGLWFIQKILKINRLNKLDFVLYSGLVWGDLPREAVEYCFEYIHENPEFLVFLEYGFASEEFFFGTIFMQSDYWNKLCIQKNFRYMQWQKRNGSYPAILDTTDIKSIEDGDYFFIRKVDSTISKNLLNFLSHKFSYGSI